MPEALEAKPAAGPREWAVYVVECRDGSLYTGVAKDVLARVAKHNAGKGAAYTRARRPVALRYQEPGLTRSQALVREAAVKRLPRPRKKALLGRAGA
ncbi:MAG: GIY-YIG nuclease family protein [Elusimicrobia bacterium]|nr:GIY-YIG nuclease family protein [Elusimicrobiota bacterium]